MSNWDAVTGYRDRAAFYSQKKAPQLIMSGFGTFPTFNLERVFRSHGTLEIIAGESIAFCCCMCKGVEYNLLNFNEANCLSVRDGWDLTVQSEQGLHTVCTNLK